MKKLTIEHFRNLLVGLLGTDRRPVVVYSATWPVASAFPCSPRRLPQTILETLLDVVGPDRTLIMPAFTNGFKNGMIDFDHEPGHTGIINNLLWRQPGTRRTASVYFSFVTRGPHAAELVRLRPYDVWGEDSIYEWIQNRDAHLLVLGLPWRYCSFLHRVEWLGRAPYRYFKIFSGEMIHEGRRAPLVERLFVRNLEPAAFNDWPNLDEILAGYGMRSFEIGHSQVAEVGAEALINALLPMMQKDPYAFVRSPELLRAKFGRPSEETPLIESHAV